MKNIKINGGSFTAAKLKAIIAIAIIAVTMFSFTACNKILAAAAKKAVELAAGGDSGTTADGGSAKSDSKSSRGGAVQTFTSITAFKEWFDKQPDNTAGSAYNVKLNISDLGGSAGTSGSLRMVLYSSANRNKYVNLDLSGCTFITIEASAFYGCSSLTSITIPNSVTTIGDEVFWSCDNLTSVTIGSGVTSIGGSVFGRCDSLTAITIPNTVTSIGNNAFESCTSLTSVTIPNSVTSIGNNAFSSCTSLTSVTIGNSVTSIGEGAFYKTSLTSVTIPNSVTSIGINAFSSCTSLTSVTIPDSVEVISGGIFFNCTSLASLPLPKSASATGVGKIFYYSKAGFSMADNNQVCHYLEAAPNDMSTKLVWGSRDLDISGTGTEIGAGRKNTTLILATDAAASAAKACKEYSYGGKTDWFLPSKDELYILYNSRTFVGNIEKENRYWSSSQFVGGIDRGYRYAYVQGGDHGKNQDNSVRAVRAF
jgi:hypothetical protein